MCHYYAQTLSYTRCRCWPRHVLPDCCWSECRKAMANGHRCSKPTPARGKNGKILVTGLTRKCGDCPQCPPLINKGMFLSGYSSTITHVEQAMLCHYTAIQALKALSVSCQLSTNLPMTPGELAPTLSACRKPESRPYQGIASVHYIMRDS